MSGHNGSHGRGNQGSATSQQAAVSMCDEMVALWRLAALNPALSPSQRNELCQKLKDWHVLTIEKVRKARSTNSGSNNNNSGANSNNGNLKKSDMEGFAGFKAAIEACQLDWNIYVIPGITYDERNNWPHFKLVLTRSVSESDSSKRNNNNSTSKHRSMAVSQVSGTVRTPDAVLGLWHPLTRAQEAALMRSEGQNTVERSGSGSSSEGFCDVEPVAHTEDTAAGSGAASPTRKILKDGMCVRICSNFFCVPSQLLV